MGTPLTGVQWQSAMYATGLPEDLKDFAGLREDRLPFVFEASGSETQFTNGFDPSPRARKIFNFPKPETLARIIRDAEADPDAPTWRAKVQQMPQFGHYELRAAQFDAVANIEKSLAAQTHSRSLVQMATGAGKTRMAVTESYRLIKYGGVDRVLFLVDRNNLADQTLREFRDYTTPNDGRKFTDLYNVDKLTSAGMIGSSKVVISTIQRVFSVLRGNEVAEDDDPDVDEFIPDAPVEADYSPSLPPEAFDLIIVDECHRSIYGVWRSVLEYFDAHILGLTATPTKQTYGFFQQNLVSEYTYPESVADGVNVDFEVFRIKTKISQQGSTIEAGTTVPKQDRRTREQRLEELDEDFEYQAAQLDRDVTSKAQIRRVLETYDQSIVGWSMGIRQTTDLVVNALVMALSRRRHPDNDELIHHPDRASQYTSLEFSTRLAGWCINPSYSRSGTCFDNAAMESTWATFKTEIHHIHGSWSEMTRSQLRTRPVQLHRNVSTTATATKPASGTEHPPTPTLSHTQPEMSETRAQQNGATPVSRTVRFTVGRMSVLVSVGRYATLWVCGVWGGRCRVGRSRRRRRRTYSPFNPLWRVLCLGRALPWVRALSHG